MNNAATAKKWTEYIASRPEFLGGENLLKQFSNGEITKFCNCGCNSYEFQLAANSSVEAIAPKTEAGCVALMLEFQTTDPQGTVEFMVFVDGEGNLEGMDVHFNGNISAIPNFFTIIEPPFHVYGPLAKEA